jgi:hypothetical protein
MYIKEEDIRDRAILNGMEMYPSWPQREEARQKMDEAEEELEQEHFDAIWQVYEGVLALLQDEPDAEECAWLIMSGITDEVDLECDGILSVADEAIDTVWYTDWEIKKRDDQWIFDHQHENALFYDTTLLGGLKLCRFYDSEPEAVINTYLRNARLKGVAQVRFDRVIAAATKRGLDQGRQLADNIKRERNQLRAVR